MTSDMQWRVRVTDELAEALNQLDRLEARTLTFATEELACDYAMMIKMNIGLDAIVQHRLVVHGEWQGYPVVESGTTHVADPDPV